MEEMARAEYPAMLATLKPNEAVTTLNERFRRINRVNVEIADWLQERRRVEEQYVTGLRRLSQFRVPNAQSELGVFQTPWQRLIEHIDGVAHAHQILADRIDRDVEQPLRTYHSRQDMANMTSISANLTTMAKTLDEAQAQADKLGKKGGKASVQKVDAATQKLDSANQQWDAQAPFIYETLQSVDEARINQLRDLLTQYQTHETDCAQKAQEGSAAALSTLLEVDTKREIHNFVSKTTSGRVRLPTRDSTRRSSLVGTPSSTPTPGMSETGSLATPAITQTPAPEPEPERLSTPTAPEPKPETKPDPPKPESKLRRLGTMFGGRRRQSVHGAMSLAPQKNGSSGFGRLTGKERPGVSPRASSGNLKDSSRLGAVAEQPDLPRTPEHEEPKPRPHTARENTNGINDNLMDSPIPMGGANGNAFGGPALADLPQQQDEPQGSTQTNDATAQGKDSEGFSIPAPMNDPISEAQREAAGDDAEQLFKLNIQNKPVEEEDPQEKQAALSSVANSLKMGPATRRTGTIRGRRDVRNTIYVPSPNVGSAGAESGVLPALPGSTSPNLHSTSLVSRPSAAAALASEPSITGTSDTQSVRSGTSLSSLAHVKHPDLAGPGLQSSIIETVSVVYEGGNVKSASVAGELAFVNNPSESNAFRTHETIRINNFPNLEKIGPNRIFVSNSSVDHPEQYALDLSHLNKVSTGFSYRVFSPDGDAGHLAQHAPLFLHPVWKPQGDKLGVLIQYQLNPTGNFTGPVTLHNVVFVVTYDGKASGVQTKPSGTHLKDKHLVYWRLGDLTLTHETQKIVCRVVGLEGAEPQPGHVEARWEYAASGGDVVGSGISVSRLEEGKGKGKEAVEDDPFADEGAVTQDQQWVDVPLVRKLVSGKYEGR